MAKITIRPELNTLANQLNKLAYTNDINRIFDDWLRFIIHGFCTNEPPLKDWHYTESAHLQFYDMLCEWLHIMNTQIPKQSNGWYDVFGSLYEGCIAGRGRRDSKGQFFTPESICDFMAMAQGTPNGKPMQGKTINDPACGSGRILLAFNSLFPGNYLVAEDIDRTCCMMTVCNFLAHGCVGEVVWHDSLDPNSCYGAWSINDGLNNPLHPWFGKPHITLVEYEQTLTYRVNKAHYPTTPQVIQPLQLTLF